MGKIKDIFTGEHRKFAWFVVVTTTLFLGSWLIGPGNTIIKWVKAKKEISHQEKQMEIYRQQIEAMDLYGRKKKKSTPKQPGCLCAGCKLDPALCPRQEHCPKLKEES